MNRFSRNSLALAAAASALAFAQPALADGDVTCGAGPQENWEPERAVSRKAWQRGWEVLEVLVQGDCYEVYARNEQGQAIEAFFHPETLELLVMFRRGREIFRKDGFTG
ncbi:PepSY domain-containing protein [Alteraurantiacibacter aquimixticola]|uniref:PepSY domain-containing protein n=1 Tax=Alteraurantiacibacter aquimixticola TaxID=2489173 RepID=A0A4T3F8Z9_9SPHN|nr:PepSY domain-containing protein [Alteraurantiacibacter aquimixticola]TIX51490.1 PepSY domain-containing protein [Alteraurantiacibacter aquimixticola]